MPVKEFVYSSFPHYPLAIVPVQKREKRIRFPAWRGLAGLVCAGACLLGETDLLPGVLAFGAWLEGSHEVCLVSNGEEVALVLGHHAARGWVPRPLGALVPHRHGPAARLVCVLAARTTQQTDHVACFATAAVCENSTPSSESQGTLAAQAGLSAAVLDPIGCGGSSNLEFPAGYLGPSPSSALLPFLRSTVLVV